MTSYTKLDDNTLQAVSDLDIPGGGDWGKPTLRRIFNFKARQVTTLYERGGTKLYWQPVNSNYSAAEAYAAALTSAMQVQNFRDFESRDEIEEMHARLVAAQGKPPSLDEIFPDRLDKKTSIKPAGIG
jgi:hypothetical protein